MAVEHRWPVTSYSVTIEHRTFGWIELKDGDQFAGYIYFTDEIAETMPRFGAVHSAHPYIVMSVPTAQWQMILDILRHERPLYIRGYQPDGGEMSASFGTSTGEPVGEGE